MSQTVLIVGSSGNVGQALLKALESYPSLKVRVGVRDTKNPKVASLPANFTVVQADFANVATLEAASKGVDAIFVIFPPTENRATLAGNAVRAAKASGVKHVVILSVPTVEAPKTIFGTQLAPLEAEVKASGLNYTIVRVPMFVDNNWGNVGSIKGQSAIYSPVNPDTKFAPVVVADIGAVGAKILSSLSSHVNKTYTLTVPTPSSHAELASSFSKALGREIKYVQVPPEAAKQAMLGLGFPEWQVDGILELYDLINQGSPVTNQTTSDVEAILGRKATDADTWVQQVKGAFQ